MEKLVEIDRCEAEKRIAGKAERSKIVSLAGLWLVARI